MLTDREKLWLVALVGLLLIVVIASFSGEPQYEICQYPDEQHSICENYHIVPYFIVETVRIADRHEGFFALLTGIAVAFFTGWLVLVGRRADEHFRVSERAYIQMSHVGRLRFPEGENIVLQMQLKNWGETPGTVTDQVLGLSIAPPHVTLPDEPQYDLRERELHRTFLVPTGVSNWERTFNPERLDVIPDIRSGEVNLFVIGYVDYMDKFKGRYRAGYARRYDHERDRTENNLVFVTLPGYNYDRPRLPGEGTDWGDS